MKLLLSYFVAIGFIAGALAQAPPSPPPAPAQTEAQATPAQPASQAPPSPEDDRFPALRDNSDPLKASFDKTDTENMTQVERLLKTNRCQISRIGGLLDRTIEALHAYCQAELTYWTKWAEKEQERVDGQNKSLAGMEADQQRIQELIATETKDREELLRKRAVLEKYPKRTQEIVKELDTLVEDIRESEARLAKAQKDYDEISIQVQNMKASITARLIEMRQERNRVEAWELQMSSFYEGKRKSAQEICNLKQPNTGRQPLPKARQ